MKKLLSFLFILNIIAFGQPKSNFDIIDGLIVSKVKDLNKKTSLIFPEKLQILKNRLLAEHKNLFDTNKPEALLSVDKINITYDNPFRYWFLGSLHYKRNLLIEGTIKSNETNDKFSITFTDTVSNSSLDEIENNLLEFTQGTVKDENNLNLLTEPIIAIGTAVISIILLFIVRGN